METLLTIPPSYPLHKLKTLPLRDQPAYRSLQMLPPVAWPNSWPRLLAGRSRSKSPKASWPALAGMFNASTRPTSPSWLRSAALASRRQCASKPRWRSACG